jgi:hypothetical protein
MPFNIGVLFILYQSTAKHDCPAQERLRNKIKNDWSTLK